MIKRMFKLKLEAIQEAYRSVAGETTAVICRMLSPASQSEMSECFKLEHNKSNIDLCNENAKESTLGRFLCTVMCCHLHLDM